jgi:hypothetical protein
MIENLLQLVKEFGEEHVVANPEVPNEQNNAVMAEASSAVVGTLQQALAGGNIQDLMGMFSSSDDGQLMSNPLAQQAQAGFVDNITSKLGINKNTALAIGGSLLPMVISTLVNRTRSTAPQDSGFDLSSLIGSLSGGAGGAGIGQLISQFTGGGQPGGGDGFDLQDIVSQVTSGARQQQGSGGIMDLVQGFFK